MSVRLWQGVLLAACFVAPAQAQFQLLAVDAAGEHAVSAIYDLGGVSSGDPLSARFLIRNISNAPATLTLLALAGTGFSLASRPSLPATLAPRESLDFLVNFQASGTGNYSAALGSDGISAFLLITVLPSLTYSVETAAGKRPLTSAAVDFGSAASGQPAVLHFDIENFSGRPLAVPTLGVGGADFSLHGPSPAGTIVSPGQAGGFDIQFQPAAGGVRNGTLTIGGRTYALIGTGIAARSPQPRLAINLPVPLSGQQGSVAIQFDAPAQGDGSGTLLLEFQPDRSGALDSAIVFGSGGRTAPFTFARGDTQARFGNQASALFQTGTTAGTILLTVQLGTSSDRQSVMIAPAAVGLGAVTATRTGGGIEIRITGFDNTRSAGSLSFTFFDAEGNTIPPGAITTDGTAAFHNFFEGSDLGGIFLLRALFPVAGDASRVLSFQANITNAAGTSSSAQITF